MNPTAIRAIEAMVAPVVLITAAAVLSTGILAIASVNDRMRLMMSERLAALTGPDGMLRSVAQLSEAARERLHQIDEQLPTLLHRHHLLRAAVLSIYIRVAVLVASLIMLAVAVPTNSEATAYSSLALVLAGTAAILGGCLFAAASILMSKGAIDYEVKRSLSLGS